MAESHVIYLSPTECQNNSVAIVFPVAFFPTIKLIRSSENFSRCHASGLLTCWLYLIDVNIILFPPEQLIKFTQYLLILIT